MQTNREKIIEAVRSGAAGGRLTCEQAHEIGKRLGVELKEIGAVCNELKVKIASCQLGCF